MYLIRMTLLLIFVTVLVRPVVADELVSIKAGFASLKPSGQFAGNLGGVGTRVDLENDLGLDRSNRVEGEAALQFGDFRFSLGYLPLESSGSGTLTRQVTFNNRTYNVGNAVDSSMRADVFDLAAAYYFINADDLPTRLQLGVELAVKVTQAEATMTNRTAGFAETVSATVPIPTIGLRGRVALADFLGLVGRVGYLGYSGNRFLDADVQLEFSPLPALGVYAGYRQLDLKVDSSGLYADVSFGGPHAGVLFRF